MLCHYERISNLIVLSELPLTTRRSRYWRQAIPRLWPFNVRTNSQSEVFQTLMVRSPEAETMYFSSKSTTFTAARWPTNTLRRLISVGEVMSQTAIERSLEHVTIMPLLKRRCKTASQWWIRVLIIWPVLTSQTRTVASLEPLMITLSSYWRHKTDPVWPVKIYQMKIQISSCLLGKEKLHHSYLSAIQSFAVPYFDGIITKAANDLLIVILQTVDAFAALASAVYSL